MLDGYPNLSEEAIHAALIYAADVVADEQFIYLKREPAIDQPGTKASGR